MAFLMRALPPAVSVKHQKALTACLVRHVHIHISVAVHCCWGGRGPCWGLCLVGVGEKGLGFRASSSVSAPRSSSRPRG